jgi:putative (di)nucleoside polyphosphate hydrolase
MPQGGIDKGEDPAATALRELYEETSIRSVSPLDEIKDWVYYDLPDEMLGIGLKGKYRGQRQRWFAYLFVGKDDEIDVLSPGGGKHPAEFDTWRWEALERLPELIVPFKRKAYEEVVAHFRELPDKVRRGGR